MKTSVPLSSSTGSFVLLLCKNGSPSSQLKASMEGRVRAVSGSCGEHLSSLPFPLCSPGLNLLLNIHLWWSQSHFRLGTACRSPIPALSTSFICLVLSCKESYFYCPIQGGGGGIKATIWLPRVIIKMKC